MVKKAFTIQDSGQVIIPMTLRKRRGLKKGDVVTIEKTEYGILDQPA